LSYSQNPDFIFEIQTTSSNESFTIPTFPNQPAPGYDYDVSWGDGNSNFGQGGDITHTYATAGNYTINISGLFPRIYFNYNADRNKIKWIHNWGTQQWTSFAKAFNGCTNLQGAYEDVPDLSNCSSTSEMFRSCPNFNSYVENWDVSNITNMGFMFNSAVSFNQNLEYWDVSNVTDMTGIFSLVNLSTTNYDNMLIAWNALSLQNNVTFDGGYSIYCNGASARSNMITNRGWTITDGGAEPGCIIMPDCTTSSTPPNGATNVSTVTNFSWNSVQNATSYIIKIGTTSGGNELLDNYSVSTNSLDYSVVIDDGGLPCGTTIYWNIFPYNEGEGNLSCIEQSFTTESAMAFAGPDQSLCQGEVVELNGDGGGSCIWSPTTGLSTPNECSTIASPSITTTYTLTVFDINGCSGTDEVTVTVNNFPDVNASSTDETANDANNGTATCNPSGGPSPYTYMWSNGETTQSISDLAPGEYTIMISDANGCGNEEVVTVAEYTCPTIIPNAIATDESSNSGMNGTATCNPTGGSPSYTYVWSNMSTSQTITGLSPGSYTVTVTDASNCTAEQSVSVSEFECPELTILSTLSDASGSGNCDGFITIDDVLNGNAPYTYSWSNGATTQTIDNLCAESYSVSLTDNSNCSIWQLFVIGEPNILLANASSTDETSFNAQDGTATCSPTGGVAPYSYYWSNGETTQSVSGLAPGTYTIEVTDIEGNVASESFDIQSFICPNLTIQSILENAQCFESCDGYIEITNIIGGVAPFTYSWSNGQTGAFATDLCSDSYSVTVVDSKNCTAVSSVFEIIEPLELLPNASSTDETANNANNGTATCLPSGGNSPYAYAWSNGETTQSISGLSPDSYTVSVTDAQGCITIGTVSIAQFGCASLEINLTQVNIDCFGNCNGSLDIINIENGNAPYTYMWSNDADSKTLSNLCPGNYNVTVIDNSNCSIFGSFSIIEPSQLNSSIAITHESGVGESDGTANASTSGGVSTYSYLWSNGMTTQSISGLAPGVYTLQTTDSNGCVVSDTITINAHDCPSLVINNDNTNVSCNGECDGIISISSVDAATNPISYLWSNGATTASLTNVCAGEYSVEIIDANNCNITASFIIEQPDEINITLDDKGNISPTGLGYISISPLDDNYNFLWQGPMGFSSTNEDIEDLAHPGCYELFITSSLTECVIDTSFCIDEVTSTKINNSDANRVSIYPNPSSGQFSISLNNSPLVESIIEIYNISGAKTYKSFHKIKQERIDIDTPLQPGLYLIKIQYSKEEFSYKKLIIN